MAAFEVIALDTATPQLRAPGASDTYTFPRAVEMPLGTANGVLYLNASKVVTSGSGLTFNGGKLAVSGTTSDLFQITSSTTANANLTFADNSWAARIGTDAGKLVFYAEGETTERMRLTSTGLGIGTSSPGAKLHVSGTGNQEVRISTFTSGSPSISLRAEGVNGGGITYDRATSLLQFENGGTIAVYLNTSGNLGLGVTPSAWNSTWRASEIQRAGNAVTSNAVNSIGVSSNAYFDSVGWKYGANGSANFMAVGNGGGQFAWFTAPSGTAGNTISFTQAMTLDASGRLLIGTTTAGIGNNNATALSIANGTATVYQSIRASGGEELYLYAASGSVGLYAYSNNELVFGTNNTARLRLKSTGQLRYVPLASDPAGAENGDVYYNSTTNKLRLYAAGAWVDLN